MISRTPAINSTAPPVMARARAWSNPESANVCEKASIPGPPNSPKSFCNPRIANSTPTVRRRANSPRSSVPRRPIWSVRVGAMVVGWSPNGRGDDMS